MTWHEVDYGIIYLKISGNVQSYNDHLHKFCQQVVDFPLKSVIILCYPPLPQKWGSPTPMYVCDIYRLI